MDKKTLKCTKCGKTKPTNQFSKDSTNSRGHQYRCKECQNAWSATKRAANAAKTFEDFPRTKVCFTCKGEKQRAEFDRNRSMNDGLNSECSDCRRERRRRDKDKIQKSKREYYQRHKARLQAEKVERKFGLEKGEYEEILDAQSGRCYVCKKHHSEFSKRLAVDHDHATGDVRGLLCWNCNRAIGSFHDSVEALEEAARYLKLEKRWWRKK